MVIKLVIWTDCECNAVRSEIFTYESESEFVEDYGSYLDDFVGNVYVYDPDDILDGVRPQRRMYA